MSIGKRIQEKRKENGLSVMDLAKAVGVNRATIYRWENEESTPPKSAVSAIAHILHTNASWLQGDSCLDGVNINWSESLIDKLYDDYNILKKGLQKKGYEVSDSGDLVYISALGVKYPGILMEQLVELGNKVATRRLADPQEQANVVAFLCSEQNSYMTGQNLIVDGGYTNE